MLYNFNILAEIPDWILKLYNILHFIVLYRFCRSQWPRGLRRRSTAARLLRLWVRIPPGAWMFGLL